MHLSLKNQKQHSDLVADGKKIAEIRGGNDGLLPLVYWTRPDMEHIVRAFARQCPITVMTGSAILIADGEGDDWAGRYILALAEARGVAAVALPT